MMDARELYALTQLTARAGTLECWLRSEFMTWPHELNWSRPRQHFVDLGGAMVPMTTAAALLRDALARTLANRFPGRFKDELADPDASQVTRSLAAALIRAIDEAAGGE